MDIENVVYTYNGILLGLIKKVILPFETTQMDLEDIMLRDIRQTQKDKYCMVPLI